MYIQGITIVFLIWTIWDYAVLYRKLKKDKSELEKEIDTLKQEVDFMKHSCPTLGQDFNLSQED